MVMLILGILGAAGAPRMMRALHQHQADLAASRIRRDIELTRQWARSTGATQAIRFYGSSERYVIIGGQHLDHPDQEYEVQIDEAPYHCNLKSIDFGGDKRLEFNGFGHPDSGGSLVVEIGSVQRTVTVEPDFGGVSVN